MNSNNENNNEGLNSFSVGSINDINQNPNVPIDTVSPVAPIPEEQMESLEDVPNMNVGTEQIANSTGISNGDTIVTPEVPAEQPIDVNAGINEIPPVEPVAPINYEIPEAVDNVPVFNDIGTVPPISNGPIISNAVAEPATPDAPKKKGMNKTLFVVLIILALCAVGGGVYVLLNKANESKPLVQTKRVKIEAGTEVSTNIKDYAIFSNINASTCNFDTSEITDTNTVGAEYKFRIICGSNTYVGKATIVDTTSPEVEVLKDGVTVKVNGTVEAGDFITECKDVSKCSYAFKDEAKVQEYLKEVSSYHVPIIVKDEAGNETEVTGTLNVSEEVSTISLICNKTMNDYLITDKFGLTDSEFNKSTTRIYTFTFDNKEDYEKFKDEHKNDKELTYSNVTGIPEFDDEKMALILTKKINYGDLNDEVKAEVPLAFSELKTFFEERDYVCSIGY